LILSAPYTHPKAKKREKMNFDNIECSTIKRLSTILNAESLINWYNFLSKMLKHLLFLARLAGFEPAACGLEVRCSIQLSYRRIE
jgi:hypothetical protein